MRKMSKKSKIITAAATVALVAGGGGAAFAYWSTTGSGTGTATNATGGSLLQLSAAFNPGLAPGGSELVTYTATNPNSSDTVVTGLTAGVTTDKAGCDKAWFTVDATVGTGAVAANSSATVGTGTLAFVDDATVNQDACKGATITITVGSN